MPVKDNFVGMLTSWSYRGEGRLEKGEGEERGKKEKWREEMGEERG